MANNVTANAGSGGATFAADDVAGVYYPYAKLAFGPDDTATIVSTSNGLPVSVINTSIAVTDNGGSLTVDGTVAATQSGTWTVTQSGTWNVGTVTAVTSITNPVAVTQSGTWSLRAQDGSGNALTSRVTGSSRPLEIAVVDASGNQITSFGGSGGTASNYGSTFPTSGTASGYSDGTNMQAARVFDADTGAGTQYVQGVNLRIAASGGSVEGGTASNPIRTDPTGTTTQPVSDGGGSLTVDGTVAATQSGSWTVTANAGTGTLTTTNASIATSGASVPASVTWVGVRNGSTLSGLAGTTTGVNGASALYTRYASEGLGQAVSSLSMPVVVASDQAVFPVSQDSATLYAGTTALTPKFAAISASSSGDNTVVAAVTSKKIRVIRFSLSASGAVNAKWKSGAATDLTGLFYMTQYGGAGGNYCPVGLFETASNTALVLNLSGAVAVGGMLTYVEV